MAGPYTQQPLGTSISDFASTDDTQDEAVRSFERGATEPTIKVHGLLWWCLNGTILTAVGAPGGATEALVRWDATAGAWRFFALPTRQLSAGGEVPMSGNLAMGNNKVTGLAAAANNGEATRKEQVILRDGSQSMSGDLHLGTHKITNVVDPAADQDAATKKYVDDHAGTGESYYQTNRDAAGDGNDLQFRSDASPATTYCELPFVPRTLVLRLKGKCKRIDNGAIIDATFTGQEYTIHRWDDQSAGADAGNAVGEFQVATVAGTATAYLMVEWKTTVPVGVFISLKLGGTGGARMKLCDPANTAVDGVIHAIARN